MRCNEVLIFKYTLSAIAFGVMTYFITACLRLYFNYPTQTRVIISLNRSQTFPAVTICSGNPLRYDKFLQPVLNYTRMNNLMANPPNITRDDIYKSTFNFMIDLLNQNKTTEMLSYGFQLQDILLDCSYNGYDCRDMWIESISPVLGNCYTFNRQSLDRKTPLFDINDINKRNIAFQYGLVVTFYLNIELYFPTLQYGLGLTGILHNVDEQPLIRFAGKRFAPGFEHNLAYEKSLSTFLGSPYTVCTEEIPEDMRALYHFFDNNTDYVYSEIVCLELCYQKYVYEKCSCVYPNNFYFNKLVINNRLQWVRTCTPWTSEHQCTIASREEISTRANLQKSYCSHCKSQCVINKFSSGLSALKGPSDSEKTYYTKILLSNSTIPILPDFVMNSSTYLDKNYVKLSINPLNNYITTYQEKATYTWSSLISDLGGQVGLWMGISVLSLHDILEYLYKKCTSFRSKPKVETFENKSNP